MSSDQPQHDRREFFRCDLTKLGDNAVLRTRQRDYLVDMLEESAGGFALFSELAVNAQQGDVLSMAYRGGIFEVEVAHISGGDEGVRIGLKRIKELKFLHSDGWLGIFSWRDMNSSRGIAVVATVLVALMGCGFLWGAWLPESAKPQWSAILKGRWREPVAAPAPIEPSPAEREQQIVEQIGLLAGDDWTAELNVSDEQNEQIEAIVHKTTKQLQAIYRREQTSGDPSQWSHAGLQLIRNSWTEIEDVLTEEQRAKWRNMRKKMEPGKVASAG